MLERIFVRSAHFSGVATLFRSLSEEQFTVPEKTPQSISNVGIKLPEREGQRLKLLPRPCFVLARHLSWKVVTLPDFREKLMHPGLTCLGDLMNSSRTESPKLPSRPHRADPRLVPTQQMTDLVHFYLPRCQIFVNCFKSPQTVARFNRTLCAPVSSPITNNFYGM
jgi:hypothetical protein